MIFVFVLVALLVLGLFGVLHWYAWRRLVRDTTRGPGLARRVGTVVFIAGPVLMVAGFASERAHAPFWLQQTLTWPGFMWLALSLYLFLALLAGELVRPLVSRLVARRAPAPARQPEPLVREPEPVPAGAQPAEAADAAEAAEAAEPGQRTPPSAAEPRPRPPRPLPRPRPTPPAVCSSPVSSAGQSPPRPSAPSATAPTASCVAPGSSASPCRWRSCRARPTVSGSRWSATSTSRRCWAGASRRRSWTRSTRRSPT